MATSTYPITSPMIKEFTFSSLTTGDKSFDLDLVGAYIFIFDAQCVGSGGKWSINVYNIGELNDTADTNYKISSAVFAKRVTSLTVGFNISTLPTNPNNIKVKAVRLGD